MKSVEREGRTVEEAIRAALEELNASREDVEIEVLDEGSRGMLGIIGQARARVRVTLKQTPIALLKELVEGILTRMGMRVAVEEPQEREGALYINVTGEDAGLVIGRGGVTLDALQFIVSQIINRRANSNVHIWVDAAHYRERRWRNVEQMALRAAQRAKAEHRRVRLRNLSAAERRIVHITLQNNPNVITYSEGKEPDRVVVIAPTDLGPRQPRQHIR